MDGDVRTGLPGNCSCLAEWRGDGAGAWPSRWRRWTSKRAGGPASAASGTGTGGPASGTGREAQFAVALEAHASGAAAQSLPGQPALGAGHG